MMKSYERAVKVGGIAFLSGLLVGAGSSLLFAPHSGAYTRRVLLNAVEEAAERISGLGDGMRGAFRNTVL